MSTYYLAPPKKWWQAAGGAPPRLAYQPQGAASYSASLVNLANPGVHDALAGVAPAWDAVNGWTFNGATQFLKTGLVPGGVSTWSAFLQFDDLTILPGEYLWGTGSTNLFGIRQSGLQWYNGNPVYIDYGTTVAGNIGGAGITAYLNGVAVGVTSGPVLLDVATYDIYIGGLNYGNSLYGPTLLSVKAFVVFDYDVGPIGAAALAAAMANAQWELGGDDAGDGSLAHPWATLEHATGAYPATGPMQPGDTLVFRGGVYRYGSRGVFFWPGGVSSQKRTTFVNFPGERPVLTGIDSLPPATNIANNFVDVEGLWIGGNAQTANGTLVVDGQQFMPPLESFRKSLRNCVLWNIPYIAVGHQDFTLFQGCKFWGCGSSSPPSPTDYGAALYFRGKDGTLDLADAGNHALVDACIFLNGQGSFDLAFERVFNSAIVTRCFLGNGARGIHLLGTGALVANNILWSGVRANDIDLDANAANLRVWNNIFDGAADAIPTLYALADQLAANNAYDQATHMAYPSAGDVRYARADSLAGYLNHSRAQIDAAIAAIAASFAADVTSVALDTSLDANFALLSSLQALPGSPFQGAGRVWCAEQGLSTDIGPGVPAPASEDEFWALTAALGLHSYDMNGRVAPASPPQRINQVLPQARTYRVPAKAQR